MQPLTLPTYFTGLLPSGTMLKRLGLLIAAVLATTIQLIAQEYFYYYKGKKQPLTLNTEFAYIVSSTGDMKQLNALLQSKATGVKLNRIDQPKTLRAVDTSLPPQGYWGEVRLQSKLSAAQYVEYLRQLKGSGFKIASPYFSNATEKKIGLTQFFYVKLKSANDLSVLQKAARDNKAVIIGQNQFMPLWFTLSTTEASTKNALQLANSFYESGLFTYAEPDLMTENDATAAPNDPFYASQWGLNNTGLYGGTVGTDINAEAAWELTKGSRDVIVAVLDHGFEQNHPDLAGNNFGTGFDTESGTTPALVLGEHGTACAGIIGAIQDNNIGVTGVAPNVRLMSVSNSLVGTPLSRQKRADGINWAWQNGAAVISNSWSSGVAYAVIDDAIDNALLNGRGGLGTVVVFASGNNNSAVSYPANSNPDIVVVGAMSECGQRKSFTSCDTEDWGSNFGPTLDVVAPGVLMPTTDRQGAGQGYNNGIAIHPGINGTWLDTDFADTDYTTWFNGTSSATPVVAGVAALVLSVNPCLTHDQVEDILEASAQKVGGYAYAATVGRPNGTWFNEMGYGLIDAEEAVQDALDLLPAAGYFDLYTKDRPFDTGAEPNPDAGPMWISEDIWVRKTADGGATHQNPEYKLNSPNAVYIRITNIGRETSTCANLSLYFSKASTGLIWPTHWSNYFQMTGSGNILHGDKINTVSIPAIAPGASYVVEIPWFPPNPADFDADIHHFCLLSRIESPADPMFNEQNGVGVSINVKNNNNIAWKNVSVVDDEADASDVGTAVFIRNVQRTDAYIGLRFFDRGFKENFKIHFFERGGQAIITGDKGFMERFKAAKVSGSVKQLDDQTILIYGADAYIGAFLVKPKETFLIHLKPRVQLVEGEETVLDVIQQNESTKALEGGERFVIRPGKDQQRIAIAADKKQGIIAYPNPVQDDLFVKYSTANESSDVKITVSSLADPTKKVKLFEGKRPRGEHQEQFNVRSLPKGIYMINIQVDDKVLNERFVIE